MKHCTIGILLLSLCGLPALAEESERIDHEAPLVKDGVLGTMNVLRELDPTTRTNRVTVSANVEGLSGSKPEDTMDGSGKYFRPKVDPAKPLVLTYALPGPRTVSSLAISYFEADVDAAASVRLEGSADGGKTWSRLFESQARKKQFLKCFKPAKVNALRLTLEGDGTDRCLRRTQQVFVYADPGAPLPPFGAKDGGAFSFLRGLFYADKLKEFTSPENEVWTSPYNAKSFPHAPFDSSILDSHDGAWGGSGKNEIGRRVYLRLDLDKAYLMSFGLVGCPAQREDRNQWSLAGEGRAEFYTAKGSLDPGTLKGSSSADLTAQGWILQKAWDKDTNLCKPFAMVRPGRYNQMLLVWDGRGFNPCPNQWSHLEMYGTETPDKTDAPGKQK